MVLAARESKHRVSARARCGYAIVGVQRLTIPITYGADLKPAIEQFAAGPNGALRMGGPKPAVAPESIRLAAYTACLRFR